MNWKRILTVLLKTAGWVVGIWLALLIILQVALSPAILTEVINRYAEENLEADLKFGNAYVSVFERFPKISLTLEDFSLTYPADRFDTAETLGAQGHLMKAGKGETADTLASFRRFTVALSTHNLLTGTIRLPYVRLDAPRIFAHAYADGSANWNIFGSPDTETIEPEAEDKTTSELPEISIGKIRITGRPHIVYTDSRDTIFASINLRKLNFDGRIHTRKMSRNRLGLSLDSMFIAGRLKKDTLALGVDNLRIDEHDSHMDLHTELKTFLATRSFGRLKVPVVLDGCLHFPKDSVPAFRIEDFKAEIASIPVEADAHIRLMEGKTGINADIKINGCGIQGVLEKFVGNFIPEVKDITTDAAVDMKIGIDGCYDHTSGRLPDIDARIMVPESYSRHSAFDRDIRMAMELRAGTDINGNVNISVDTLDVLTAGVGLSATGSVSDVLGKDPELYVKGSMSAVFDSLKAFLPDTLDIESHGTLTAGIDGSIRMSEADIYNFSKSDLTGFIKGDSIRLHSPADTLELTVKGLDVTLGPENITSRRDPERRIRLMGIKGKAAKADIKYKDALTIRGKDLTVSAKNSSDQDTTKVTPLSGRFTAGQLSVRDQESSTIVVRNTSNSFMVFPKKGQPEVPVLSMTSRNERIFLRSQSNRLGVSDARLRVSAAMNTVERRHRREAFLDSLARVYPDIPRDSLFAHSRSQRSSRPVPEWLKDEDFRKQDIDIRLDETLAKYFREWDLNGRISIAKGFVMTPMLPLRNTIRSFKGHFTNNEIGLDSLKLAAGDSEMDVTGKLTGLRRALLRKGTIKAELDMKAPKVDASQLLAAYRKGQSLSAENLKVGEDVSDEEFLEIVTADTTKVTDESSLIVIPSNINADIRLEASDITYQDLDISRMTAQLVMKERCVQITNTSAETNMGHIGLDAFYSTRTKEDLTTGFSISFKDITAEKVINLMPAVDSLMPMLKSFKGLLNCEMAATARLDTSMNLVMPSIDGILRIGGQNLTITDSDLYKSLASKLMFKNKEEGKIESMTVEGLIRNSTLEVFPFIMKMDRYTLAMSGIQNLDQSFRYHASLIKSPFLIKLGVDLYGNDFDNMKFKIGKAKYKDEKVPAFSAVIDNTKINLVKSIKGIFEKGVESAVQENRNATAFNNFMQKIGYIRAIDQKLEGLSEEEQKQIESKGKTEENNQP